HPRWPKGHPKGGQFRPSGVSRQKPVRPRTRIHFDVAVRERGHKIALGVNPEVVWSMFAEKAYGSPRIVAQMAVREALQNSRDACEAVGGGEIAFGYDASRQQAWFEDTGVGMDADTLEHKFLCLGETGKAHEVGAVGGFGVAKAVILSLSDPQKGGTWSIHTRDLALASHELEKVTGFRVVPERQGTAIRWDHISAAAAPGLRKGLRYMQCSDVGRGITMRAEISDDWHGNYNGEVSGLSTTRRKPLAETTFNDGETTLRLYKVDIDKENERRRERGEPEIEWEQGWENLVIRLGGLAQVVEGTRARGFYVVDVETTARPGSETYPFDPHRTGLKLDVGKSWLRDQLEQLTVEEKTGATIEGEAEACPVLLRQSDLSPDNARKIHALVQELGKLTDELHEYREARRKTGPQPPEALQDMSFARAELGLGETWGPRPPDDTVALDATAGRFLGPETPAGESRSIGIHQLAGLLIGQWYMTAVANHLAGRHLDPVPVDAIPGDVPAVASMTHAGMRGESVGLNVSYVSEAMISPDALDNFLFAEAVHEFAHLLEDSHDTDFAAAESQIHRGLWTVRRRLASDTRRLWKAYRAAGEATATRARAAEVPAPQGQLQLLKAVGAEDLAPLAALVEEGSRQLGEREALAMADTARVLVATVRRGVYWPEERALDLAAAWARELARDLPLVDRMGRPWVRRLYEAVLPLLMPAPPAALVRFGD
ncbi:MAG: ATP-binding protein, partial [Armatimonadota bacterium]|nr:ATP-binding protein [Armatimonadota bacterium]